MLLSRSLGRDTNRLIYLVDLKKQACLRDTFDLERYVYWGRVNDPYFLYLLTETNTHIHCIALLYRSVESDLGSEDASSSWLPG